MTQNAKPILIAGGGMAGLLFALLLRQQGHHQVVLVEPMAMTLAEGPLSPSFDARSTALSAGTLSIFARLGLYETLLEDAAAIKTVEVSRKGRLGITRMRAEEEGVPALGAVVENRWLGQVLLSAVLQDTGIRVLAPNKVVAAKRLVEGYQVELEDGDTFEVSLLVAADGAQSSLRQSMGISAQYEDTGTFALVANVEILESHHNVAWERFLPTGPLALLPLSQQRLALIWMGPKDYIDELKALPDAALVEQITTLAGEDRIPPLGRVGGRITHPLIATKAVAQVVPYGVVVGNAAHTVHPVGGQGFNLTARDLSLLAEEVGDAQKPGELQVLERYIQAREKDQAMIRHATKWLPDLFRVEFGPFAHTRQLGLVALDLWPSLRTAFAQRAMGVRHV